MNDSFQDNLLSGDPKDSFHSRNDCMKIQVIKKLENIEFLYS